MNVIKSFFCDGTGEFSIMRVGFFIGLIIGIFVMFYSLFTNNLNNNADFIKWYFGIIFGSKVFQSLAENLNSKSDK
jgi:hypothetical protein